MSKSLKHLEQIRKLVSDTINSIESGSKEKDALRMLSIGLDKKLANLVNDLGGTPYFFKKTNESSLELAMGEVY